MQIVNDLQRLSGELRKMPRHLWDKHLLDFCEQLLIHAKGSTIGHDIPENRSMHYDCEGRG
jgi:hypothetical protein